MTKINYISLVSLVFFLNSCATFTDDNAGIIIYENEENEFSKEIFEIDEIEMQRKKSTKIIIQPNSKHPELRFKIRASAHCKKYGRVAQIKSIQPKFEISGEVLTRYHEEYYCRPTS